MPSHANGVGKHLRKRKRNWLLIVALLFIVAGSAFVYWQGTSFFLNCIGQNRILWFANYGIGCYSLG